MPDTPSVFGAAPKGAPKAAQQPTVGNGPPKAPQDQGPGMPAPTREGEPYNQTLPDGAIIVWRAVKKRDNTGRDLGYLDWEYVYTVPAPKTETPADRDPERVTAAEREQERKDKAAKDERDRQDKLAAEERRRQDDANAARVRAEDAAKEREARAAEAEKSRQAAADAAEKSRQAARELEELRTRNATEAEIRRAEATVKAAERAAQIAAAAADKAHQRAVEADERKAARDKEEAAANRALQAGIATGSINGAPTVAQQELDQRTREWEAKIANEPGNFWNYVYRLRGQEPPMPGAPKAAQEGQGAPVAAPNEAVGRQNVGDWRNYSLGDLEQFPDSYLLAAAQAGLDLNAFRNEFLLTRPALMAMLAPERIRGEGKWQGTGFAPDVTSKWGVGAPTPKSATPPAGAPVAGRTVLPAREPGGGQGQVTFPAGQGAPVAQAQPQAAPVGPPQAAPMGPTTMAPGLGPVGATPQPQQQARMAGAPQAVPNEQELIALAEDIRRRQNMGAPQGAMA